MTTDTTDLREKIINKILAKQDDHFRWGYDAEVAQNRPEWMHYVPTYKATIWTLILLADLAAPTDNPQINEALNIITQHFYDEANQIFTIGQSHFPIPCLNGNMLYLHMYFGQPYTPQMDKLVEFFSLYQRFDDGEYQTPKTYPYFSNKSCYGSHTCYWGVVKLLKGLAFIPRSDRPSPAQNLLENCIEFILHHEVCFRSHDGAEFLHRSIDSLTFPNFYTSDVLEILWLLAREGIQDPRLERALDLLRAKRQEDGTWPLERQATNLITSIGSKRRSNVFVTGRAQQVLDVYGH